MIPAQQYRSVYVQNCWMQAATLSQRVVIPFPFPHVPKPCLFYGGNSGGIDFMAKHKPDNSCTLSVTLNSEKDSFLLFLVS